MKIFVSTIVAGAVVLAGAQAFAADKTAPSSGSAAGSHAVGNFFTSMGRDLVRQSSVDPKEQRRKTAGKMVTEGKCDEAMKMALEAGDIDLAASLKTLCVTSSSAK